MNTVYVYSDYVCPYCYLEMPELDQLAREFDVEIEWRAFELRPEPVPTLDPKGDYLKRGWARAVYPLAAERGMTLRLPPVQPRSRLALEGALVAREEGRFDDYHRGVFRAFFEEGRDIGSIDVLSEIAIASGLDAERFVAALAEGRFREQVVTEREEGLHSGLTGVPATIIGQFHVSGAQPYEVLRQVAERAGLPPRDGRGA